MTSEVVNTKINLQISKKLSESPKKCTKRDVNSIKKDNNLGLRVPGSNWQKFKNLIAEAASADPNSTNIVVKKQHNRRPSAQKFNNQSALHLAQQQRTRSMTPKMNNLKVANENDKPVKPENQLHQQCQHPSKPNNQLTKAIAMDCEMVGIGDGTESMLARISLVNRDGVCIYDKYVKPTEEIKDYRTPVSGIQPHHLKTGEDFKNVQKEVSEILKGRILVGHALHNDLDVLFLSHPKRSQRDTSRYKVFRKVTNGNTPSLKKLAAELLGINIQSGQHNSIEDAKAAMQLYQLFRRKWENDIRKRG